MQNGVKPLLIGSLATLREGFAYKLHLVVNDQGELLNIIVTEGNIDDRTPVPKVLQGLRGKVFADKGYVSKTLRESLWQTSNIELITKLKRNMKNHLMSLTDRLLLRKRSVIESIIDQLKNISQIVHEVCQRHTFPPPKPSQLLGQHSLWTHCVLPSTEKAFFGFAQRFACCGLTRTHVI
jgi:transposase